MMEHIKTKAATLLQGTLDTCRDRVKNVLDAIKDGFTWLYKWHRRLMMTNPAYPVAILSIGKAIIRLATPNGAVAAAAVALLAALLNDDDPTPDWEWDDGAY